MGNGNIPPYGWAERYRLVNNLTVKQNKATLKWEVWTPKQSDGSKKFLEEFTEESNAILWAKRNTDFLTEKGRERLKAQKLTEEVLNKGYF